MTVTGKLIRAMALGGESTGWVIQLELGTQYRLVSRPILSRSIPATTSFLRRLQTSM